MHRKSLLWHIFLPFLAVIVLSLVLITGYTSRSLRDFFYDQTEQDLHDRAQLLFAEVAPMLAGGDRDRLQAYCRERGRAANTRMTLILPDGEVVGDTREIPERMDNHGTRPEVAAALAGQTGRAVRYSATLRQQRMYVALPVEFGGELVGVLRTSRSLASVDRTLSVVQQRIALGGLLLALGAGVISYGLARRISVPLREMKEGAERFAKGQFGLRLNTVPDSEEIGALAEALNTMAAELNDRIRTIENQRNEQQAVLASMVESVLAIDRDETIIGLNQASCELLGLDQQDATGRSLQEVVRTPALIQLAKTALAGSEPVEGEIVLRRDGERHLQVHATGLQGPDGQRLGALLVLNDVTRMRRLETLRRDFVANVSHELRTPITSIKGFVETLRDTPPSEAEAFDRFLAIINRQADRLQHIIDDLLSLSRLEQGGAAADLGRQDVRVAEVLLEAVNVCTARRLDTDVSVNIDCPVDLHLPANPALLEQAVVNLVDNALKHSGTTTPVRVSARREGERVLIRVTDGGRGIAPEHLPRVFERFYRVDRARSRKLGGTGLGLAIVKHIAQAHGGEATVTSEVGRGTTFTIAFPATTAASGTADDDA
jgi:two-component system phosphate regulon sensor histidine kinase PhoR